MYKKYIGKKIFMYVNYTPKDISIGITKKIRSQIETLRKLGFEVTYTAYLKDGVGVYNNQDELILEKNFKTKIGNIQRYYRRFLLIRTAIYYLKQSNECFDYAYLRWHTFDRLYIRMLKIMKDLNMKTIIEAHAYTPNAKATSLIGNYNLIMNKIYSKKAKEYVDLIAGISEYDNIIGIKTVKIDNGIDVESIIPREDEKNSDTIRIISVSNEYSYHGYDRLIKGLYNYYNNGGKQKFLVKFVGVFMESTKKMVEEYRLSDKVIFYGKKFGSELDKIYNESDIGIGALAHHRVGLYSGSSLKTKEYFAKGLPFIYGWKEPAFDESYPYAKKVDLNEEPIDINEIIEFYDSIKNKKDVIRNMRKFAEENYSWEIQMSKVFEAIENQGE